MMMAFDSAYQVGTVHVANNNIGIYEMHIDTPVLKHSSYTSMDYSNSIKAFEVNKPTTTHLHPPSLTSTHPHPPPTYSKYFHTHAHPPKIMPHTPPLILPTQNNVSPTQNNPHLLKIMPH